MHPHQFFEGSGSLLSKAEKQYWGWFESLEVGHQEHAEGLRLRQDESIISQSIHTPAFMGIFCLIGGAVSTLASTVIIIC